MYTLNLMIVTQILRLLLLILFWISGATREIIRVRFLIDFLSRVTPFTLAAIYVCHLIPSLCTCCIPIDGDVS